MQIIVKALEEIFPISKGRIIKNLVKINTPKIDTNQLKKLGELTILYDIEVRRSGKGVVVLMSEKSINNIDVKDHEIVILFTTH